MHVFGACDELALHEVDPYKRLTAAQALHHTWIHNRRKSANYLEYVQNVSLQVLAVCCTEKDRSAFKCLECALTFLRFFLAMRPDETPSLTKPQVKYAFDSIIEDVPRILLHGF